MVFILSYVLAGVYFVMLFPFLFKEYRVNPETGHIRSISAMICQFRPLGHFVMSLGNLMLFEIITLEYKNVAWAYWASLQLVLCFDIDQYRLWHFVFLLTYIFLLLFFWGNVCQQHNFWVKASGMWVMTGLFSLTWLFNMVDQQYRKTKPKPSSKMFESLLVDAAKQHIDENEWRFENLQSVFEILWAMSVLATTAVYEYELKTQFNITSDSYYG
jgi:hypothetical protein